MLLCPLVIIYRVSTVSYAILRRVVTGVTHIGLINILAKKTVCLELLQNALTPETLANELEKLICNADYRATMLAEMRAVNTRVGAPGATARIAARILDELPH